MQEVIYILSTYVEDGADDVKATTDEERLHAILDEYDFGDMTLEHERLTNILASEELLAKPKHYLSTGWGGVQLHVVQLTRKDF